jgi:hypothetical protein
MKRNQQIPILIATAVLSLSPWCAPNAFADGSLVAVPLLGTDTSNEARAVSPDAKYVVGLSGTAAGFFYDVAGNTVVQPQGLDYVLPTILTGIAYRNDTNQTPAQPQLIVSGLYNPGVGAQQYAAFMTPDGGVSWDYSYYRSGAKRVNPCVANSLAGTDTDYLFGVYTDEGPASGDNWTMYLGLYYGQWGGGMTPATVWDYKGAPRPNSFTQLNGVSSKGRAVGWRSTYNGYTNLIADMPNYVSVAAPTIWYMTGLDGTILGQADAINADGTIIFGTSAKPAAAGTGATNFPYKATLNTTFPGAATQLGIGALPNLAGVAGCPTNITGTINAAIPYGCTLDGKYAVGMSYVDPGLEKATLWDTSNADTNQWAAKDLTALASANGILGNFTNLTYAYSIGTNATGKLVVVGKGYYSEDNGVTVTVRGFVMTVPSQVPFVRPPVAISTTPQKYTFTVPSVTGKTYSLEFSTVLPAPSWTTIGASVPGTGSPLTFTDLNPADPRRFYRIKIQ